MLVIHSQSNLQRDRDGPGNDGTSRGQGHTEEGGCPDKLIRNSNSAFSTPPAGFGPAAAKRGLPCGASPGPLAPLLLLCTSAIRTVMIFCARSACRPASNCLPSSA